MKIQVCRLALTAVAALFLTSGWALCADNTPPAAATPGTPPAQDTKSEQNNPSGPADQTTAAVPPDSKKVMNTPNGPDSQKTASGAGSKSSKKHHKHKKTTDSSSDSGPGTNTKPEKQ